MKTAYLRGLREVAQLQILIKEEAADYAAEEILDIEALIINTDKGQAIQYMIDEILKVTFEVAKVGVDMNSLATAKRIKREAAVING